MHLPRPSTHRTPRDLQNDSADPPALLLAQNLTICYELRLLVRRTPAAKESPTQAIWTYEVSTYSAVPVEFHFDGLHRGITPVFRFRFNSSYCGQTNKICDLHRMLQDRRCHRVGHAVFKAHVCQTRRTPRHSFRSRKAIHLEVLVLAMPPTRH